MQSHAIVFNPLLYILIQRMDRHTADDIYIGWTNGHKRDTTKHTELEEQHNNRVSTRIIHILYIE
jgi:hypothetical protein